MRAFVLLLSLLATTLVHAQSVTPPPMAARAWLLLDHASGQPLVENGADERVEPASLTKLMTAYLTFAALKQGSLKPDQVVPVSEKAWKAIGSRMFIEPKRPVTVNELVHGMIIQSGNDACIALAEAISGTEEVFVQRMNLEAQRLGLTKTHYVNTTGLPDAAALFDGARSGPPGPGDHPRFSGVLPDLLQEGIQLQPHHPAQPQSAALARSDRRWRQDRPYRGRRLSA